MTEVSICCAPADVPIAEIVARRLETTAEVRVRVESSDTPASEAWEVLSAGVLLLVSPRSVPPRGGREPWTALLGHSGPPSVALLEIEECPCPPLLRRRNWFRWQEPDCLRQIQRWAVGLHMEKQPRFQPSSIRGFSGDLEPLWRDLVDQPGSASVDDVQAAQEFAHQAAPWFRDVLWVGCLGRTMPFVAGEIAAALHVSLDCPPEMAFDAALSIVREHRILLILDGLDELPAAAGSSASLLCVREREVPLVASDDPLLLAMSVCLRGGFPIELPAQIAGVRPDGAERWADCIDRAGGRYRLRVAARSDPEFRRRHAEYLRETFSRWIRDPEAHDRLAAEVEPAVRWALRHDCETGASLAQAASGFFRDRQRHLETAILVDLPGVQFMRTATTTAGFQLGLF